MEFINKELSLKIKEKGFDRSCFGYYYIETPTGLTDGELVLNRYYGRGGTFMDTLKRHDLPYTTSNLVDAPTIDQVLEWLREDKDFMVFPVYSKNTSRWYCEIINADSLESYKLPLSDSYEDAAIAGIEYTIDKLI